MKQLYIITYENAQWRGGELLFNCLVWANSPDDAEDRACTWMEEQQLELFYEHYDNEPLEEGDTCVTINSTELLADSYHYKYTLDPSQEWFYPCINSQ